MMALDLHYRLEALRSWRSRAIHSYIPRHHSNVLPYYAFLPTSQTHYLPSFSTSLGKYE